MTQATKNGDAFGDVPEASATGESQSNGRAGEQCNSLKINYERSRRHCRPELLRHCQLLILSYYGSSNMWSRVSTGNLPAHRKQTAYEHTYGKRSKGRTEESGEKVLNHAPKKLKSKLVFGGVQVCLGNGGWHQRDAHRG